MATPPASNILAVIPQHILDAVTDPKPISWNSARDMDGCGRLYNFGGSTLVTCDDDGTIERFAKYDENTCVDLATGELLSFCRDGIRGISGGLCSNWKSGSEIDYDG